MKDRKTWFTKASELVVVGLSVAGVYKVLEFVTNPEGGPQAESLNSVSAKEPEVKMNILAAAAVTSTEVLPTPTPNPATEFLTSLGLTIHKDTAGIPFFTDEEGIAYGAIETVDKKEQVEGYCPQSFYIEWKQLFTGLSVALTPKADSVVKPDQFAEAYFLNLGYEVMKIDEEFYLVDGMAMYSYSGYKMVEGNKNNPARMALSFVQNNIECATALAAATAPRTGTATMINTPPTTGTLPPAARQSETPQLPASGTPRPAATNTPELPTPAPTNSDLFTRVPPGTAIPVSTQVPLPTQAH